MCSAFYHALHNPLRCSAESDVLDNRLTMTVRDDVWSETVNRTGGMTSSSKFENLLTWPDLALTMKRCASQARAKDGHHSHISPFYTDSSKFFLKAT